MSESDCRFVTLDFRMEICCTCSVSTLGAGVLRCYICVRNMQILQNSTLPLHLIFHKPHISLQYLGNTNTQAVVRKVTSFPVLLFVAVTEETKVEGGCQCEQMHRKQLSFSPLIGPSVVHSPAWAVRCLSEKRTIFEYSFYTDAEMTRVIRFELHTIRLASLSYNPLISSFKLDRLANCWKLSYRSK